MREKMTHVVCLVILIIGLALALNSIGLGESHAHVILRQHGGSMDTNLYNVYIQESIRLFNGLGLVLILLGGLGEILLITRSK